jgi:hypothetical protein
MSRKPPESETPPRGKKAYATPRLSKFGTVGTLVQAGTQPPFTETRPTAPAPRRTRRVASDAAIKEHAVRVGTHPLGFGLYLFEYRAEYRALYGTGRQFGVMAHEVEPVMPQAVSRGPLGHKLVDYGMLGVDPSAS